MSVGRLQRKSAMENFKWESAPKKRYKDNIQAYIKDFNIPPEPLEQTVHDRAKRRSLVYNNDSLKNVENDLVLGVYIDNNLTWAIHIQFIAMKVS